MNVLDELRAWGNVPVELPGWDRYSIWGWNAREGSLYAEMWTNDVNPNGPALVGVGAPYTGTIQHLETLALVISERLGIPARDAAEGLAAYAPEGVAQALLADVAA